MDSPPPRTLLVALMSKGTFILLHAAQETFYMPFLSPRCTCNHIFIDYTHVDVVQYTYIGRLHACVYIL